MDRILSWKIDSSTYAYIYPIKNSYISNRIPENSPLWGEIINEISVWSKDTYRANFDRMASEVKSKYGQTIPWQDQYWDFSDDNTNLPVNIVLLSGKDGDGSGNGGNGTGSGDGIEIYEELRDAINKELDKAKKDIEEQNRRVEEFVEQKVSETIAEAKNTIAETKKELAETRAELEDKLDGAAEALDKAAALFDMGEGGITGEQIQDALSSVSDHNKWITSYSGSIVDFQTDYDAAKRILGGIGSAEDALAGLFSQIGTTINDMDNTVGNVESWMVASAATIGDIATWYDVNASAVTEASSIINASAGTITDAINFISGDGLTTKVTSIMDGRNASIKEEIMTETSAAVTNVKNELNGLSGLVETSITRLDNIDGDLVSLGSRMNAEEQKMEQWINVSDSAMSLSHDLRDTWSVESGKLSTVANLTAETDGNGNIIYYVSGTTGEEIIVSHDGVNWVDAHGTTYAEERVYVHWSQAIGSYIQQQASSITMSVMNSSGLTAAIKLAIERGESGEDESVIKMVSDKLIITGDMIAQAISANTANIGGIHMGMGQVWSEAKNGSGTAKFRLDGVSGTLYASDADISGTIHAKSLILGNNQSIENYVTSQIPTDWTSEADVRRMITAFVSTPEFKDAVIEMGYVTEDYLKKWAESQSGLTEEQVKELIKTMAGAEVNGVLEDIVDATDGGTWKRIKIGGEIYQWKVFDAGDMVLLNRPYSGESEHGFTSVLVDSNGLLQGNNAIIHGMIYAIGGEIGGFGLLDSKLTVSRNGNYEDHIAFLNGSDKHKDTERGTLILAAGVNTGATTYYKYVSSEATEYKTIYTKRKYSSNVGDSNNTEVIAYTIQKVNGVNKFVRCENQFYFIIEKVANAAAISEDDIVVASSDGEEDVVYKESVVRKYTIETSQDGDIDVVYDYYSYESTTTSTDNSNANTMLYEDGTLFTETIIANGGYFSGELDAKGRFSGELQDATGTLKGVTIEANYLTGNIVLNTSNSLKAKGGQELYFSVGKEKLTDSNTKEYWNVDEVFWERQNANGENAGQTYTKTLTIASVSFKSGATITIPAFSGSVYRYAPAGKTNKSSNVKIVCSYRYNGESNSQPELINKTIPISSFSGADNRTNTLSTDKKTFTASKDGTLTIKFTYDIHLSTYSWLGADKAYCKIKFNTGGSKINVEYPKAAGGTSIASNGMRVLTSGGAKISAIDSTIELLSPNAKYGLQITDSGIKYKKDGGSWTSL